MRRLAAFLASLVLAACGGAGAPSATEDGSEPGSRALREPADRADATAAPADPADPAEPSELPAMPPFATARIVLVDPDGRQVAMPVYVADDDATRKQGLMGVTDLPSDAGMVFLFPEDRDGGFWMKNTLLPLSIAFFDADGTVGAVLDMEPCEADPCPSYKPGVTYRGALEVNQGAFADIGLEEGWTVDLPPDLSG